MTRREIRRRLVFLVIIGWIIYRVAMGDVTRGEWYIIGLIVMIEAVWPVLGIWAWRRFQLWRTFIVELPDGNQVVAITDAHGSTPLKVRIRLKYSTEMNDIHFRFSKTKDGPPVPAGAISVEGMQSLGRLGLSPQRDGQGGCHGHPVIMRVYPDQPIDLLLAVRALAPWSGYLVFTGRDDDEHPRTISKKLIVVSPAPV